MRATIHFHIRYDRPAKDGSVPIYLVFLLDRKHRTKLSLGKYVPLKTKYKKLNKEALLTIPVENRNKFYNWDDKTERLTPVHHKINSYLDKEKARAIQIIEKFEAMERPILSVLP